jgi:alpha-D-xyloside xylohydrolase
MVAAPYGRIPLFVRAGSIVPMGPGDAQNAGQTGDPIEVRVYPGRRGRFELYDDAGDGYAYERGGSATVPLSYDGSGALRIGARRGGYRGMPASRRFKVLFVSRNQGTGVNEIRSCRTLSYTGEPRTVRAEAPGPPTDGRPGEC